jgi:predicted amidohydrolase
MIPEKYRKYEKTVAVACVNWHGTWGDKVANLEKIMAKISEAAQLGANIVVFPELALSGYECGEEVRKEQKPCSMHVEAAETIPGPATERVGKLTRELGVYVIFGMPEKDSRNPDTRYISAPVIGPDGLIGRYRKLHLAPTPIFTEDICFKPGNELPVFETNYGPIGVQICADFWNMPELSRILYLKGARIIFNLAGSAAGPGKSEFMTHQTAGRAIDSFVYTASCNHVGKERALSYYGHSTIAGPAFPRLSKIFAQGGEGEEIVMATLNFEWLHYMQSMIDVKKIGNWALIVKEYKQLVGD